MRLSTIDFRGDTLFGAEEGEAVYMAVTPICEALTNEMKPRWGVLNTGFATANACGKFVDASAGDAVS